MAWLVGKICVDPLSRQHYNLAKRRFYENIQAAESRIRDADMAEEMVEFTKNSVLVQSGTAMLAQANLQPQSILRLLS